jgi:hypothetical protein
MRYQEQNEKMLHELNELVYRADEITATFAAMEPIRAEASLTELASLNETIEFKLDEFKKLRDRMSVQIIDGGKLFRDDYEAALNIVCPDPNSQKRIDANKNGLAAIFLEPFVLEEQRIVEVTIKRHLLRTPDLQEVANLRALRSLSIMTPDPYSFKPLAGHPHLESLTLTNNTGTYDYSELSQIPHLKYLRISNCKLSTQNLDDIFQKLSSLTHLEFGPDTISSLRGISHLKQLTNLVIVGNEIPNLLELAQLTQLQSLSMHRVGAPDLTPLLSCNALAELKLKLSEFENPLSKRLFFGGVDNRAIVRKLVAKGVLVKS